jgi:uncharacterized damage-inducible protein DinB
MKRFVLSAVGICVAAFLGARGVSAGPAAQAAYATPAATAAQSAAADKTAPSYDMKAQSIQDLQDMQKKFTSLAEAIPADKYSWKPGAGVRTVSELFLHVASANYGIPNILGTPTPAGFNGKTYEKSTTDKAKIIEELNKSFTSAIGMVQNMTNADFAKPEKKLGPDANDGDVVYLLVVHAHEQLGHAIVYARSNGVVPPWTAEALKKNPKAQQE